MPSWAITRNAGPSTTIPTKPYSLPVTVTDNSRPPGSGAGIFQTVEAYRDLDNTYDPGGRLGQLAIRFNW